MTTNLPEDSYWWQPLEATDESSARTQILEAAYREIHLHGFQAASLSRILGRTGLTKGALYHHFPNKTALGLAVIDEVLARRIELSFIEPIRVAQDPIEALIELIEEAGRHFTLRDIELGCPLSALSEEMSSIDEDFRQRLVAIYERWRQTLVDAFRRQQETGRLDPAVDPESLATMVVATLEGCLQTGKITQSMERFMQCGCALMQYLNRIRQPEGNSENGTE